MVTSSATGGLVFVCRPTVHIAFWFFFVFFWVKFLACDCAAKVNAILNTSVFISINDNMSNEIRLKYYLGLIYCLHIEFSFKGIN